VKKRRKINRKGRKYENIGKYNAQQKWTKHDKKKMYVRNIWMTDCALRKNYNKGTPRTRKSQCAGKWTNGHKKHKYEK